jgi:hypothetical protein
VHVLASGLDRKVLDRYEGHEGVSFCQSSGDRVVMWRASGNYCREERLEVAGGCHLG